MTDPARNIRRAAGAQATSAITAAGKPKAVLYARYSSDKQNEMSCEDQLDQARETAHRLGFDVVGEYRDEAISGMTLMRSRPGIVAM